MKFNGPKVKMSRSLGVALTPKAQKYMEKRPYPPGMHGEAKGKRRQKSVYGTQLLEKQRLRFQYNISERQMRNYFRKAARKKGKTGEILVQQLETRLDAFVLRAGLARTIYAARQFVGHGHIEVNGSRVDIPSFQVKVGDVVAIKETSRKNVHIVDAVDYSPPPPAYIERQRPGGFEATLLRIPPREEIPVIADENMIVEFYSK
jgi:small subunit ribosomal protein S4